MTRIGRSKVLALLVALTGFLLIPSALTKPAHGETRCSTASLNGPYAIAGSGTIFGSPASFIGTFVFDGLGKSSGGLVLNIGGSVDNITGVTGDYKIDGDCVGADVIHTAHHKPAVTHYHDMQIVVADGGRRAFFQAGSPKDSASGEAPPGEVVFGTFEKL